MDMKKIFSIFNQNPKMISRKENWGFANMCWLKGDKLWLLSACLQLSFLFFLPSSSLEGIKHSAIQRCLWNNPASNFWLRIHEHWIFSVMVEALCDLCESKKRWSVHFGLRRFSLRFGWSGFLQGTSYPLDIYSSTKQVAWYSQHMDF
jgi:hypothetical protein